MYVDIFVIMPQVKILEIGKLKANNFLQEEQES